MQRILLSQTDQHRHKRRPNQRKRPNRRPCPRRWKCSPLVSPHFPVKKIKEKKRKKRTTKKWKLDFKIYQKAHPLFTLLLISFLFIINHFYTPPPYLYPYEQVSLIILNICIQNLLFITPDYVVVIRWPQIQMISISVDKFN